MQKYKAFPLRGSRAFSPNWSELESPLSENLTTGSPLANEPLISVVCLPACGNIQGKEFVTCPDAALPFPGLCPIGSKGERQEAGGKTRSDWVKGPSRLSLVILRTQRPWAMVRTVCELGRNREVLPNTQHRRSSHLFGGHRHAACWWFAARSPSSGVLESVIGVTALGIRLWLFPPIVFVTLRILAEAVAFSPALSGSSWAALRR